MLANFTAAMQIEPNIVIEAIHDIFPLPPDDRNCPRSNVEN
jgi:hypothetical protein